MNPRHDAGRFHVEHLTMPRNFHLHLKGGVGYWNFSADQVSYVLDKHKDDEVHVLINSLGGSATEGMAISALFRNHGNVHVHYMAANASAATIAAMGAKRISMDVDAVFLVHKCMNLVFEWDYFNADELDEKIKELEKQKNNLAVFDCTIAGMYARRCKKPQAELLALMKKDTWLTAQEALEWGFIDEITEYGDDDKPGFDDATVSAMASVGIPIPPCAMKKDSAFARMLQNITSFLKTDNHSAVSQSPVITMPKLESLESVLGSALTLADGAASLDEAQLKSINKRISDDASAIAEKDNAIAEKDRTIADLQQKVADLAKQPAEPSATVTESGGSPDDDGPSDDIHAEVQRLMSQLM